jgi:SAM-dependent methyltransferase
VDPSPPFVDACRASVPGADVRLGTAEELPFQTGSFEAALSQLVLSFVADAGRMVAEAARVVRPGGVVAACTFEANGFELARTFWAAALRFDPAAPDDSRLPFRRSEELLDLWRRAGLRDLTEGIIDVAAAYSGFELLGEPPGPFTLPARALAIRGRR